MKCHTKIVSVTLRLENLDHKILLQRTFSIPSLQYFNVDVPQNPFSTQPSNTHGIIGRNFSLSCATDGTQIFWLQPDGQTVADSISGVYPTFDDKYILTNEGNTYTLVLVNVEPNDAGCFACNSQLYSATAYAEVIILGKNL